MTDREIYEYFSTHGEPYAAGLFKETDKSLFYRHCLGYAEWFNTIPPVSYGQGERLYPAKDRYFKEVVHKHAVRPQYCHGYEVDEDFLIEKSGEDGKAAAQAMLSLRAVSHSPFGWMHGAPNYKRIVHEGFDSYRDRVSAITPADERENEFRLGLLLVLDAMKNYAKRCLDYLISVNAPKELTQALAKVPFSPAGTYYEGLVAWNTVFYFDGCDNLGCLDMGLADLYNGEDLTDVIAELFTNIDAVNMWSCSIGPEYNEITRQAIRAVKGKRRPMLELRVSENTPDDIWQLAYEGLMSGCGNPSFYNDKAIHDMLHDRFPFIGEEDLKRFCGCGCTETNLEGLTHAGGTDCDVNLLECFEQYIGGHLGKAKSFEEFFEGFTAAAIKKTEDTLDRVDECYAYRAKYNPNPMRTILFDDCIDNRRDFSAGGARYNWTMNSESGLINVIDSLAAVRKLYYEDKKYTAEEFLTLLKNEDADFYAELKSCPCFGRDDDSVDLMGAEFARRIFTVYREKKPVKSPFMDGFTLTEHQFLRYDGCGRAVGPTPDGRHSGQPTCDSLAAVRGKATQGPTAMLRSSAKLPQNLVDGISVVNLTLSKSTFTNPVILKGLVAGYFALGGIQLQFTVTSKEELEDAMLHPDEHGDLIVRVGGYCDYFRNLSPSLRQSVLDRNLHEI